MPSSSLTAKIIYLVAQNAPKFTLKGLQNPILCVTNCIFILWCQRFCNVACLKTVFLGSLSNNDSDGYENVTWKVKSRYLKLYLVAVPVVIA